MNQNRLQIVDRMTIARHILSDQTDPFTRAPLTMDLVIPQDELKANIQQWMEEQKRSKKWLISRVGNMFKCIYMNIS